MTENNIKEKLSEHFVGIVAANLGYKLDKPTDNGEDLFLHRNIPRTEPDGQIRYVGEGCILALQLKSTTMKSVKVTDNGGIVYDMEAKTYRDLITRLNSPSPLVLILFVLPQGRNEWLDINDEGAYLRNKAFWYVPPKNAQMTDNSSSIRITIPSENSIRPDTLSHIFKAFFQ